MYLCKWHLGATDYEDEQPDGFFKQTILIENSGSVEDRADHDP